jgi:hypothetical protein
VNREEALTIWAPHNSQWGAWTKPVLFSFMSDPLPEQAALMDRGWKAIASSDVAIVVELPGTEAVIAGLQFAKFGYRPIPLFNACPYALDTSMFEPSSGETSATVDVMSIMRAIERNTEVLNLMRLPESAPPAFLLDANRSRGPLFPGVGMFDNRSVVRKSDLPSGDVLKAAGIRYVVLVRTADKLSRDLHSILLSWQNDGLRIQTQAYAEEWNPSSYSIRRRNVASVISGKLLMWLAFRTNSLGSFGRTIHSAGG